MWRLTLAALPLSLGACATSDLEMTYYTDPPGAQIFERGEVRGQAPVTLSYEGVAIRDNISKSECVRVVGPVAQWPNGERRTVDDLKICPSGGKHQKLTITAPSHSDAPSQKPL